MFSERLVDLALGAQVSGQRQAAEMTLMRPGALFDVDEQMAGAIADTRDKEVAKVKEILAPLLPEGTILVTNLTGTFWDSLKTKTA